MLTTDIRKFFNLSKDDDVRQYVVRRTIEPKKEGAKPYTKAPKIQRLITPQRLQRKRDNRRVKKLRVQKQVAAKAEYDALVAQRIAERKQRLQHA
jgi:hypothetical protein